MRNKGIGKGLAVQATYKTDLKTLGLLNKQYLLLDPKKPSAPLFSTLQQVNNELAKQLGGKAFVPRTPGQSLSMALTYAKEVENNARRLKHLDAII